MAKYLVNPIPLRRDEDGNVIPSKYNAKLFTGECEGCRYYRRFYFDNEEIEVCGVACQSVLLRRSVETRGPLRRACGALGDLRGKIRTPVNPSISNIDEFIEGLKNKVRKNADKRVL